METIVTDPKVVNKREVTRTTRACVSLAFNRDPELYFEGEVKLFLDGEITDSIPCSPVRRNLSKVADERVVITDPRTKQPVSLSAACLIEALTAFHAKWFKQDGSEPK
jgi:hypothetical protein